MDYDEIGKDELIGSTVIDLGDRWFNEEWHKINPKPIELRDLFNPSTRHSQGKIELWVDIMTEDDALKNPPEDISPPKAQGWQLRVVIWETTDVVPKDKDKSSDIFVTCKVHGQDSQTTDVHYFSKDGRGLFNWRMIWDITLPSKLPPRFIIQIWDKDFLKPNDAICEAVLNFRSFFRKAFKGKAERVKLGRQTITMDHPNFIGPQGKVELEVELVPGDEAKRFPVGLGRGDPNRDPFLAEPARPKWSFNPFRVDKWIELWWDNHRCKFVGICVGCMVVAVVPLILLVLYLAHVWHPHS